MAREARILVIEPPSASSDTLASRLRGLGLKTVGAHPSAAERLMALDGGRPDFLIVDAAAIGAKPADLFSIIDSLAAKNVPSLLVGADSARPTEGRNAAWHDVLPGNPSPQLLARRIRSAMRLNSMQSELERRIATCASYGVDAPSPVQRDLRLDHVSILVLGPGREFGAIDDALSDTASIVGAFSPAMATDYLASRSFDLVIADLGAGFETICDLAGDLRRDPRFFGMPLLLVGAPDESGWAEAALNAGVTEIIPSPAAPRSIRARALSLAREHRFAASLKAVYEEARHVVSGDALTGLYTRGFLMAHLANLLTDEQADDFRLAVFEIANIGEINASHGYAMGDRIIRQIGMTLGNLLRGEDLPARLGGARFAALLIDADNETADKTMRRVASFVNATRFGVSGEQDDMAVSLRMGCAGPTDASSADDLIAAASSTLR